MVDDRPIPRPHALRQRGEEKRANRSLSMPGFFGYAVTALRDAVILAPIWPGLTGFPFETPPLDAKPLVYFQHTMGCQEFAVWMKLCC